MKKSTKTRGVTLVELLIVVVILAALAMIAIPRVSQSATTAKQHGCATNVDLINSAIEMYYVDNNGSWPATLAAVTVNTTYFPDGAPACPVTNLTTSYTMNATTHRVSCGH